MYSKTKPDLNQRIIYKYLNHIGMTSQYLNFKIVKIDDKVIPNTICVKFEYIQEYGDLIFTHQDYINKNILNDYIKSNRTDKIKLIKSL